MNARTLIPALLLSAAMGAAVAWTLAERSHGHSVAAKAAMHPEDPGHADDSATFAVTDRTGQTELFLEYPPLVKGETLALAVHLTRLSDFRPVAEGRVTVLLSGGGAPEERFEATASTTAGIFRPAVSPAHAGRRALALELDAGGLRARHALGEVEVFADAAQAARAARSTARDDDAIGLTKERQWATEFAVEPVAARRIRDTVAATATVRARSAGEALVAAPGAGRVTPAGAFPRLGQRVSKGEVLAWFVPRLGGETDLATLERDVRKARLQLDQTTRERERVEGLYRLEAVPEKRLVEARNAEAQAQAELDSAAARLAPHRGGSGGVALRAAVPGTLIAVGAAPGAAVEAGSTLFHIADTDVLWLEARVPEAMLGRIGTPAGAWFRPEGFSDPIEIGSGRAGRLVAFGGAVDRDSRTVPAIFEFANPDGRLRIGMAVQAHVLTGAAREAIAVPASAIVEDGGESVVFVQKGGESFERRRVTPGARDGDRIEIRQGLQAGEHVVTRGAWLVRLAAAAPASLAHGHAH